MKKYSWEEDRFYSKKEESKASSNKTEKALAGTALASGATSIGLAASISHKNRKIRKIQDDVTKSTRDIAEKHGVNITTDFFGNRVYQDPIRQNLKYNDENFAKKLTKAISNESAASAEQAKVVSKAEEEIKKINEKTAKLNKGSKIALGVGATALAANIGYKSYKHYKNKKEK